MSGQKTTLGRGSRRPKAWSVPPGHGVSLWQKATFWRVEGCNLDVLDFGGLKACKVGAGFLSVQKATLSGFVFRCAERKGLAAAIWSWFLVGV